MTATVTRSHLPALVDADARFAKPDLTIRGYVKEYDYVLDGLWEYSRVRPESQEERFLEHTHSVGHASDTVWTVRVASAPHYGATASALRTPVWISPLESGSRCLPVELHHTDVLPSLLTDDVIAMQVTLLADTACYRESDAEETVWQAPAPIRPLREIDTLRAQTAGHVHVLGVVRDVQLLPAGNTIGTTCCVELLTRLGALTVVHLWDELTAEQQDLVCIGNTLEVTGRLVGDVAIDAYQDGARYDRVSLLRLLKDALSSRRPLRAAACMTERVRVFGAGWPSSDPAQRRDRVLADLARLFGNGSLHYAHLTHEGEARLPESTPCLIHATPNGKVDAAVCVSLDDARRIERIALLDDVETRRYAPCADSRQFEHYGLVHARQTTC